MDTLSNLKPNELVFPRLGLHFNIDSIAFRLFGIDITWYGIIISSGLLLAMLYAFSRMKKIGVDPDRAVDAIIGGVIGGIIGARAYYVAFHWAEFGGNIKHILNIRTGGLGIYGGIIGALLVGGIICKIRKIKLLPMLDIVSLGFLIGQCIGRWGNFMNHEAFGCNTNGLFGMSSGRIQSYITANYPDGSVSPALPVHPCFFYESMWCLTGFLLLHFISKKWRKFDGQIFLMYIVWYGMGRFWIEGLRTDSLMIGTLRVSQCVAAVSVVAGIILLCVFASYVKRMGSDYVLYCNTQAFQDVLAESAAKDKEYQEKKNAKKTAKNTTEESVKTEENVHILQADADEQAASEADTDKQDSET